MRKEIRKDTDKTGILYLSWMRRRRERKQEVMGKPGFGLGSI
jgi:hypothetical protein